jgi:(p)ppGpp synthase/HD superfamily hydrolase
MSDDKQGEARSARSVRRYGPRFESALVSSCALHFGQERKANGAPYISHPLAVAALVAEFGGDEEQAIAALLHDTMEDCGVTRESIAARYGAEVANIVWLCTDTTEQPKPPWRARKEAYIERLRGAPARAKLVAAADKLHNVQCIAHDLRRRSVGQRVWARFRADRAEQRWYFAAVVEALGDGWQSELLDELATAVAQLG